MTSWKWRNTKKTEENRQNKGAEKRIDKSIHDNKCVLTNFLRGSSYGECGDRMHKKSLNHVVFIDIPNIICRKFESKMLISHTHMNSWYRNTNII